MFNVGDEICACDDSMFGDAPFQIKKGTVLTVAAVYPKDFDIDGMTLTGFWIGVSVQHAFIRSVAEENHHTLPHYDFWPACRFRKIVRKPTREELYSLIGIEGMVDQREGVSASTIAGGLPYPEPSLLPMCRWASPVLTASLRRKGR